MIGFIQGTARNLKSWAWTKDLLYWLIISAGTFSELAFLLASTWMSINATEHSFILMFMSQLRSEQMSYFAKSTYVILPVFILPLAVTTTIGHLKTWIYTKKFMHTSGIWTMLYGMPALTFLIIDIFIIGNSNSENYMLPDFLVTLRSIMAYAYGLIAILYYYIGKPQEADRLSEKDELISEIIQNSKDLISELMAQSDLLITELNQQIAGLNQEIATQKTSLHDYKTAQRQLLEAMNKSDEDALQAYSSDCINWLRSGIKTASPDEINRFTGISKRKISNAITGGNLQTSPRNKELILISSLVTWLKNIQPGGRTEEMPALRIVNN